MRRTANGTKPAPDTKEVKISTSGDRIVEGNYNGMGFPAPLSLDMMDKFSKSVYYNRIWKGGKIVCTHSRSGGSGKGEEGSAETTEADQDTWASKATKTWLADM